MSQSQNSGQIRLRVAFRNMFYTTIYVAVEGGFLADEGLDVDFAHIPTGQASTELLKAGSIDISQSGISRSLMDLDAGSDDPPLHIAEINQRDGFFLLSRQPVDNWQWSQLVGSTLIPVGFTPVPFMTLKAAMRNHGVDPDDVHLLDGLPAEEMLSRFRNGDATYLQVPCPFAEELIRRRRRSPGIHAGRGKRVYLLQQFCGNPFLYRQQSGDCATVRSWVLPRAALGCRQRGRGCCRPDFGGFSDYERQILVGSVERYKAVGCLGNRSAHRPRWTRPDAGRPDRWRIGAGQPSLRKDSAARIRAAGNR